MRDVILVNEKFRAPLPPVASSHSDPAESQGEVAARRFAKLAAMDRDPELQEFEII